MPRKRKGNPVHGWVNFDKPLGMTSTQAVGKIRWMFQAQKAGHAGTLDPLATGILPIALGEATKTIPFMTEASKSYAFTVKWGEMTDTLDAEGDVIETSDIQPDESAILSALPNFIGDIEQIPPRYSAIKIDGQRAYDLARGGQEVEMKSREVHIESLTLRARSDHDATFDVLSGKGTYVRSLARDIARHLGTCGYVTMLRRTRVGGFDESHAFSLDALEKLCHRGGVSEALRPVNAVLDDIPVLSLTSEQAIDLKHGRAIALPPSFEIETDAQAWVLAMEGDKAAALCEAQDGALAPKRVFNL